VVSDVKKSIRLRVPDYQHPRPFCTVHLRRTDKISETDDLSIKTAEINDLNTRTVAAILKAKEKGITSFFLASDDEATKNAFALFLAEQGLECVQPPNTYNLIESYYDIWVMKSSSLIIQSMMFSTFSLFPCILWDIPLWTVYENSPIFKYKFHEASPISFFQDAALRSAFAPATAP
jgi:hypothetical protein